MSDVSCIQEQPKHIPRRTCVGCRKRKRKQKLLRCIVGEDGVLRWDKAKTLEGRGAYICGNACLKKALASKAFQRAFRGRQLELGEEMYSCG
jgi:predicted RNA-binding protein YlxR (DUF448 family)